MSDENEIELQTAEPQAEDTTQASGGESPAAQNGHQEGKEKG